MICKNLAAYGKLPSQECFYCNGENHFSSKLPHYKFITWYLYYIETGIENDFLKDIKNYGEVYSLAQLKESQKTDNPIRLNMICDFETSTNKQLTQEELDYIADYLYDNYGFSWHQEEKLKPNCFYCETCEGYQKDSPYHVELF